MSGFIQPRASLAALADPAAALQVQIFSGWNAARELDRFRGRNTVFDTICDRLQALAIPYEDQCSTDYYYDLFRTLRDVNGEVSRVVEVGVYMGGSAGIIAGCGEAFDFDLDLVDLNVDYLLFSYERIRRMFPDAARRVRLFHGDLPAYVRNVMMEEGRERCLIHHDGAHDFNQVVRDLASLSFVRDQVHSIVAQDTHLRGRVDHMNFVDLAIYAVFGTDLSYIPIGAAFPEGDPRTAPNPYQGNYFVPYAYEGMVIPIAANSFRYPYPDHPAEHFLPAKTPPHAIAA